MLNKILARRMHQKDYDHDQVDFIPEIQGLFNIWKSTNVINYINVFKDQNHTIISIYEEKTFDKKNQHAFIIKP